VAAGQHGGGAVPPHRHLPGRHPGHRGLPRRRRPAARRRRPPLHARLRAREEGAGLARRRLAPHGSSTSPRARAPRAASASTCGWTSRCSASTTSAQPARGERDLPDFLGIDPAKDWIPVRPAQHYTMGGVRTDASGQSPTLKGLFAAGEAACWDMHGFNRLGGNSVAETVVAGMIVGERIADFCDRADERGGDAAGPGARVHGARAGQAGRLRHGGGTEERHRAALAMQEIMTAKVGIFRHGESWQSAVDELQQLLRAAAASACACKATAAPTPNWWPPTARRRCSSWRCAWPTARWCAPKAAARTSAGPPAPQRRRLAQAHAGHLARRGRHAAHAGLRAAGRDDDGAAAGLARLRRQGLHRPPRHRAPRRRGGCAARTHGQQPTGTRCSRR
jgi:hypothetical protein